MGRALGWLVFGQLPDAIGLVGMAIIGLAGVTVALRSRFSRSRLRHRS